MPVRVRGTLPSQRRAAVHPQVSVWTLRLREGTGPRTSRPLHPGDPASFSMPEWHLESLQENISCSNLWDSGEHARDLATLTSNHTGTGDKQPRSGPVPASLELAAWIPWLLPWTASAQPRALLLPTPFLHTGPAAPVLSLLPPADTAKDEKRLLVVWQSLPCEPQTPQLKEGNSRGDQDLQGGLHCSLQSRASKSCRAVTLSLLRCRSRTKCERTRADEGACIRCSSPARTLANQHVSVPKSRQETCFFAHNVLC